MTSTPSFTWLLSLHCWHQQLSSCICLYTRVVSGWRRVKFLYSFFKKMSLSVVRFNIIVKEIITNFQHSYPYIRTSWRIILLHCFMPLCCLMYVVWSCCKVNQLLCQIPCRKWCHPRVDCNEIAVFKCWDILGCNSW